MATHPSSGPRGTLSQVVYYWIMICTVHALYTVPNYSLYHSHLATPVIWTSRHTVPIVMLFDMYRTLSQLQYSLYVPQPLGYTHTRHLVLSAHCPKIYTIGYLHALYSVQVGGLIFCIKMQDVSCNSFVKYCENRFIIYFSYFLLKSKKRRLLFWIQIFFNMISMHLNHFELFLLTGIFWKLKLKMCEFFCPKHIFCKNLFGPYQLCHAQLVKFWKSQES